MTVTLLALSATLASAIALMNSSHGHRPDLVPVRVRHPHPPRSRANRR